MPAIHPRFLKTAVALLLSISASIVYAADGPLPNPFFVFEDGLGTQPPAGEIALAKKVGFAGIAFDDAKLIAERVKAASDQQLPIYFLYLAVDVSGTQPVYEPGFSAAVAALQGSGAIVWLTIRGNGPMAEQLALRAAEETADLAARYNLRVALYPHFGFYVQTLNDAMRIAGQANRSNLGYTFNLCHELRSGAEDRDLKALLGAGLSRLYAVSINGADAGAKDWDTLIQPLDRGSFDTAGLVHTLISKGYRGPIGLQCYAIKGDPETNLKRSMKRWTEISAHP